MEEIFFAIVCSEQVEGFSLRTVMLSVNDYTLFIFCLYVCVFDVPYCWKEYFFFAAQISFVCSQG